MAAFPYKEQELFLLDSVFLPNNPINMPGFSQEPNNSYNTKNCFSQIYQSETLQEISFHQSTCLENSTEVGLTNINEPCVTITHSKDSSSVVDKLESGEQVTQKLNLMDKKRCSTDGSSLSSTQSKDAREEKGKKQKTSNVGMKDEEKKPKPTKREQKKTPVPAEEAPTGYIHVRAKRGQATDSHSLAERIRREKISERMKLLQALVPGCDKVTGKAMMLDEIINYVQSLQNQVEFLSMKLASANPMLYDFGMDLDPFMVTERLNNLASPQPNVLQCNSTPPTAFSDSANNNFSPATNFAVMDSSTSFLFQQGQLPNNLSQADGQLLWDVDEQRQKYINQSCLSNNLSAFHQI